MKRFDIDGRTCRFCFSFIAKHACLRLKELVFPLLGLVDVHIELLGQFYQRLLAAVGCKRHLRLESQVWFRRKSSRLSPFSGN
ncbi:hypothetical protein [Phyllobacterium zundukense]|uniref:hypothetical protein n=1 Tax=Phyllobacterium zundukense TaxID=1867719 RepID=UPI003AAEC6DC